MSRRVAGCRVTPQLGNAATWQPCYNAARVDRPLDVEVSSSGAVAVFAGSELLPRWERF